MIRIEHASADVLQQSAFALQALSGRLPRELVHVPRTIASIAKPNDRWDREERAELATTLARELGTLAPHVAVVDALRKLEKPGTFAVITGQQPGFLASPLYSLYKALQSIALARELEKSWGTPVVALFWNHADDSDLAEVNHAHVVNVNLDLQKITLAALASGKQPLSRIFLDDETHRLAAIRAALAQLVDKDPFAARALEIFVPKNGESLARAFTRAFTELLGPLGLLVIEPDWIRPQMSHELSRIVAIDPAAALARGVERVKAAGLEVAIDPTTAALVFELDAKGRRALRAGGDGFRYDGEDGSRTGTELAAEIVQNPLAWSPGALLRPVIQDLVLPTVAYVGGFGELAYHVELGDLRDAASAPRTAFVPRISATLVDPEARLALRRLEVDVATVLRARGVYTADAAAAPPPAVLARMNEIAKRTSKELASLKSMLAELDAGLAAHLKRTGDAIEELVAKLVEKGERVHQNKSGKGRRHERRANNVLFPKLAPQERVLGPLTYVARFGEDWVHELCAEMEPLAPEHLLVNLAPEIELEDNGTA
ncbi:MAG: bacillithiol biosynthesis cysteine-adding enzyme BshC [Planctomycetota bacterium]|nr:bacillithiol biosynthesis cysteine-adding enzyme BshC [Planctomycetota bacterium]